MPGDAAGPVAGSRRSFGGREAFPFESVGKPEAPARSLEAPWAVVYCLGCGNVCGLGLRPRPWLLGNGELAMWTESAVRALRDSILAARPAGVKEQTPLNSSQLGAMSRIGIVEHKDLKA